ncbi:nucleocapsid protein [Common oak ringspot-associated virus]|uniref:Nucleocapsid protein n=1 Tax=Common oak ringspot-associated virus TaxID=2742449 RepID=A0A7G2A2M9_9VIRU|nr:nucleocapsid protein [Common oak ringspot-associated virus]CAD0241417.1 nucleocapsid protein [Common oak ringspot-associated virus]CAD0281687.1 nucleocapsid protein [Common oak ringspot-associated virus]
MDVNKITLSGSREIEFTDVKEKNGLKYTKDFGNRSQKEAQAVEFFPLSGLQRSNDGFSMINYKMVNAKTMYQMITNSEKMNQAKKAGTIQKVENFGGTDETKTLYITPNLQNSDKVNVVSFNRAMAICINSIMVGLYNQIFDWSLKDYKNVAQGTTAATNLEIHKKLAESDMYGNKLALAIGMQKDHRLYWFYATGYEYTFDNFPAEVIATTIFRVRNREALKLTKITIDDIIKSTATQASKHGGISSVIQTVGQTRIMKVYESLETGKLESASHVRIEDFKKAINELFPN